MKFKILYFTLLVIISFKSNGQSDTLKPIVRKFTVLPSSIGYIWQGTHNFDFGIQPMLLLNAKNYHDNLALVITANYVYINNSSYLTPRTKIKFYKELKSRKLAWIASIGHSYTNMNSKQDHRITPEIGISSKFIHITYGYNLKISDYIDNVTNYNRLSIRFGIW